jgi:broad specificity phosphatase PhoE
MKIFAEAKKYTPTRGDLADLSGECETMKTINFVRHGESVANAGGVTMPHDTIPLSDLGHLQARELAALLDVEPSTVLVSSMTRTHQTAAPFCERFSISPQACSSLDEFSVIDPALIDGLDGPQRKPFVQDYWGNPDPHRRLGVNADTFAEFEARVSAFIALMDDLPDATVIFGHGIWFGLLLWRLLGYSADDADGMRSFRRFQLALPMPNCAVFSLAHIGRKRWSVQADAAIMRRIAAVRVGPGAANLARQ